MPLITVVIFFIFVGLLFLLSSVLKNRKKLKQAVAYGISNFEIELPHGAAIDKSKSGGVFPSFSRCSDSEAFFQLITPYIGSLNNHKRDYLYQHVNDLKNELKMNKEIYQFFIDEYKSYEGLNDEQAAKKWSGKG